MFASDLEDFDLEVKMLSKLRHPGIVSLYGVSNDTAEGAIYIVLEFCGGGILSSLFSTPAYTPARMGNAAKGFNWNLQPMRSRMESPPDRRRSGQAFVDL